MTEQDAADAASVDSDGQQPADESNGDDSDPEFDVPDDADLDGAVEDLTEETVEPDAELIERVEDGDPEAIAREIAVLRTRADALESQVADREAEVSDLRSKLKRKQADFENYKKRMKKRREEEKQRAAEDVVTKLFDVRDNLARALDQDEDANIRDGVEATLRELDRVLDEENVEVVEPAAGEAVDPQRHEVLMRVESDQPADTIADVHRPGYEMAGKVLREAQVTVSDGE
jgi:molecular chaperone GrpE